MSLHPSVTSTRTINIFNILEQRFKDIHGDKYNYSKFVYKNTKTKGIIICKEHGEFKQSTYSHSSGQGCPKCAREQDAFNRNLQARIEFVTKANKVHNNKYEYLSKYVNNKTKINIKCPIEGHGSFYQTPSAHLSGGGCKKCANVYMSNMQSKFTHTQYINTVNKVHNNKYEYLSKYDGLGSYVIINCTIKEHGVFKQKASTHLNGGKCPKCRIIEKDYTNIGGWSKKRYIDKRTTLYYLRITHPITNKVLYKFGITMSNVKTRYRLELKRGYKIEILNEEVFEDGQYAWLKEQMIKNSLKEYRYKGERFLSDGGDSELLVEDVYLFEIKL